VLPAQTVNAIRNTIIKAEKVIVITHIAPDGDAISSLTAAGLALRQLGKNFRLVCDDGLPSRFSYLPLSDQVYQEPAANSHYDLLIALDAGDADRMGQAYDNLLELSPYLINIDHHATNTMYGNVNLVQPKANSTTEVLYHLLPGLGVDLTPDLAVCLLTGLVTDTLSFRTAGVNSSTLKVASTLVEAGADLFNITTQALNLKSFSTLIIWQKGLDNMKIEDGVLWTAISNEERLEASHDGGSSFGLGNMMADVYQAAMSAVMMEMGNGRISVGFRCRPPHNVSELARSLGGGGHDLAAGCSLDGPLEEAEALVVAKSKEAIRKQRLSFTPEN
jgi:phosphoesterase RecJ-like protein